MEERRYSAPSTLDVIRNIGQGLDEVLVGMPVPKANKRIGKGRIVKALNAMIKEEFGHEVVYINRLYPGRHQRAAGAWLWCAKLSNGYEVGSIMRMSDFIGAPGIDRCNYGWISVECEIFPKKKE